LKNVKGSRNYNPGIKTQGIWSISIIILSNML